MSTENPFEAPHQPPHGPKRGGAIAAIVWVSGSILAFDLAAWLTDSPLLGALALIWRVATVSGGLTLQGLALLYAVLPGPRRASARELATIGIVFAGVGVVSFVWMAVIHG